jgi:hypothetical protein
MNLTIGYPSSKKQKQRNKKKNKQKKIRFRGITCNCVNSSLGRLRAGVPVSNTARAAWRMSSLTATVRVAFQFLI